MNELSGVIGALIVVGLVILISVVSSSRSRRKALLNEKQSGASQSN